MSTPVTVIDIGIGNLSSVLKALKKAGATPTLTSDPEQILQASKLILPGVGAFGAGSEALQKLQLIQPIRTAVLEKHIPILGFCMGMQLFATTGYENGSHPGLDLIQSEVRMLDPHMCPVLPHMGWNNLESTAGNLLFSGLGPNPHFYFVHSFHMTQIATPATVNMCRYGDQLVVAAIAHQNIYGTQFHPEKSQSNGISVLKNFIDHA